MGLKWILNSALVQVPGLKHHQNLEDEKREEGDCCFGGLNCESGFQMPLHYPRYTKLDYEKMEETMLDLLLKQYGLCFDGTLEEKREFAAGAFLWPDPL